MGIVVLFVLDLGIRKTSLNNINYDKCNENDRIESGHFVPKFCISIFVSLVEESSICNTTEPGSRAGPGSSINMAVKSLTVSGLSLADCLNFQEVGEGNYAVTGGKKMLSRNTSLWIIFASLFLHVDGVSKLYVVLYVG